MNLMEANEVVKGPEVFSQLEPEVIIDKTDQERRMTSPKEKILKKLMRPR